MTMIIDRDGVEHPVKTDAVISPDGVYRYRLDRTWDPTRPLMGWVMLNPSTADATVDDPTIRRCVGFAIREGFGGITVRNLYALRATDPRELDRHPQPIGVHNNAYLQQLGPLTLTVCGWGARAGERGLAVARFICRNGGTVAHLGLTKGGAPRHPLYLSGKTELTHWNVYPIA